MGTYVASPTMLATGFGKQQLSEAVASCLREQIISGAIAKGQFLRIDGLSQAFGLSTTPIREGLLLLQSESYVQHIPRRGFVVTGLGKNEVRDLFWAQAIVGAELATRAATRMTRPELARLQQIENEHQAVYASGDRSLVTRIGHEFHRTINLAARSPRLAQLLGNLVRQLPNRFYTSIEGQLEGALEYHPIIIEAIRAGDAEAAGSLMHRHIVCGAEFLIASLERQSAGSCPARAEPGSDARGTAMVEDAGRPS